MKEREHTTMQLTITITIIIIYLRIYKTKKSVQASKNNRFLVGSIQFI